MKKNTSIILIAGFAVFSMFFGSGNLVFPLQTGVDALSNYSYAALGLFLTGILLPFVGLFSVLVRASTGVDLLMRIGKVPGLILIFMTLALMGPLGVGPRCVLVAYGGLKLIFPNLSMALFSAIFCVTTGYIIWRRHAFVDTIGRWMTPLLLMGVFLIILFGILFADKAPPADVPPFESFLTGATYGYQTMDLLAAFFFSSTVLGYLKFYHEGKETRVELIRAGFLSCSLGIALLAFVYLGFVVLGAKYAPHLAAVAPEQMLTQIAGRALGVFAMPVTSITVMLACLTTLIVLTNLFSEFFHEHVLREKIDIHWSILLTLCVTFAVSLFGFKSLAVWIGGALSIVYPALIALAIASILRDLCHMSLRSVQIIFYGSSLLSIAYNFYMG